jgi:hypothetical protein
LFLVGFVAAGVWIKTSRAYDPPKPPADYIPLASSEDIEREKHLTSPAIGTSMSATTSSDDYAVSGAAAQQLPLYDPASTIAGSSSAAGFAEAGSQNKRSIKMILAQYGIPLLCPLVFAAIASIFI